METVSLARPSCPREILGLTSRRQKRASRIMGDLRARKSIIFVAVLLVAGAGVASAFSVVTRPCASPRTVVSKAAVSGGTPNAGSPSKLPGCTAVMLCATVVLAGLGAGGLSRVSARSASRAALRAKEYWEGEWICADCGYIYNERAFGGKFEDMQMGFKCPSCAAPRRRFARKLGDKIGTTLDGGDAPILIFTGVCLVAVFAIAYFALQ